MNVSLPSVFGDAGQFLPMLCGSIRNLQFLEGSFIFRIPNATAFRFRLGARQLLENPARLVRGQQRYLGGIELGLTTTAGTFDIGFNGLIRIPNLIDVFSRTGLSKLPADMLKI